MPPKNKNNKGHQGKKGKSKAQREDEDFDRMLLDLKKVTKARSQERAEEERQREEQRKRREELLQKLHAEPDTRSKEIMEQLERQRRQQEFQQLLQQLMQAQRAFLDEPNTDFSGHTVTTNPHFAAAVGEMQGWRANMEDAHVIDVTFPGDAADSAEGLFCVFDGHSGRKCATECAARFPKVLRAHHSADGVDFSAAFLEIDAALRTELGEQSGCTAVAVHVTKDTVSCASVGDSRAVLCRAGAAFALSEDHKPELPGEAARIAAAGGTVQDNRVNGQLAMSRAMGDFQYKQAEGLPVEAQLVIPVPDVVRTPRGADDTFLVVACDGIFDVLSNEELIALVAEKKAAGTANEKICEEVCRHCLAPAAEGGRPARPEGTDNMTIMIVDLL